MVAKIIRRLATSMVPMLVLFCLLLGSLYLLADMMENLERFGRLYLWLLLLNMLGLGILLLLIAANTWNLISKFRQSQAGIRLTIRLVVMFVILAFVPVTVVYSFSVKFLRSSIDSWFTVQVEEALESALQLSRDALSGQMRTQLRITSNMTDQLSGLTEDGAIVRLNWLRQESDASELTLLTLNNRVLVSSTLDGVNVIPNRPDEGIVMQVRSGQSYVGLDPVGEEGLLHIRVVVPVLSSDPLDDNRILQALYPVREQASDLAAEVESSYGDYRQLVFLRDPLKVSFILTLSLVLLMSVLSAIWGAFFFARKIMVPIQDLAEGTQAVAAGNYATQLPLSGQGELGFLVKSFNQMTRRLTQARDVAERSQKTLESQRAYLEAVLGRISTGVVTFDARYRLLTANEAAQTILEMESLLDGEQETQLQQFLQAIQPWFDKGLDEWSEELELFGAKGRKVLNCRASHLNERSGLEGYVLVFDDITRLLRVQREEAWSEVARRLAHEIKNPLTPIQLSAERLRHRCLPKMVGEEARILDGATNTIINQVQAMKSMVKAFAEYATLPSLSKRFLDLNNLVREVAELYMGMESQIWVELDLGKGLPQLEADVTRLRQLLHNLIKNAMEAQGLSGNDVAMVRLTTRCLEEKTCRYIELRIQDNGPGFPPEMIDRVFEPYVSSKPKGSGLGLAIVKKIVEEHGGVVHAENGLEGGALMVIRFPVSVSEVVGLGGLG
ncbi:MAG: ATP-binding protein [Gammaproteobacteria bacterium]|nr:ATP-binding protein [Gammaproteobacteria bacterium]